MLSYGSFLPNDRLHKNSYTPKLKDAILDSYLALERGNIDYFIKALPASEHWRLFREFSTTTAYIDIETTGLSPDYCEITTIALYNGREINHYVQGRNLGQFIRDIRDYDLIVTFNGKSFDVPFIEKFFEIEMNQGHIDLRHTLASLGFSGGLKHIEKLFKISRGELDCVDGAMAVHLWEAHRRGCKTALSTLLAYNIEDVVNLEYLMHASYNLKVSKLGFQNFLLNIPNRPYIPFEVDTKLIAELAHSHFT